LNGLIHIVGLAIDKMCIVSEEPLEFVSFLSLNLNAYGCVLFHLPVPALVWLLLLFENGLVCFGSLSVRLLYLLVVE